jgi:signal transduction histidine kinase
MATTEVLQQRELEIAREVAQAFLTATQPLEVYRLALARVTALVGASFSSVFLRDTADPELLRLVCAQNWPQSSARFLSQLRIRVGRGPTGRAVAERQAVTAEDVFADLSMRDWWDPARELGFSSMIALPLEVQGEVAGALSFYFVEPRQFEVDELRLLSLVAAQLAATAERAQMIENLQTANERLRRKNEELQRRIEEAAEGQRLKNEFLANMSHELRTPLTAVLGYNYLISAGHAGPVTEAQADALAKTERAANILLKLMTDLLELSHLKLGRARVTASSDEAVGLFERALAEVGPAPEGISLRVETPNGRIPLVTDGIKVLKILENLLSNAFKFTAAGEVRVTIQRYAARGTAGEVGRVRWVIQDTGIGIQEENRSSVFDEFRQVDGSSTRLYGGTGLGLALSLRLARLMNGEIMVESEPGEGSTFTLELPTDHFGE